MGGEKDREDKPQRNTAPGNEGSTHVGIENSSAILSSLTQYSRLIGEKYRRHLDAQREVILFFPKMLFIFSHTLSPSPFSLQAREAALALSAALHEYGDVFDSPQVNKVHNKKKKIRKHKKKAAKYKQKKLFFHFFPKEKCWYLPQRGWECHQEPRRRENGKKEKRNYSDATFQ